MGLAVEPKDDYSIYKYVGRKIRSFNMNEKECLFLSKLLSNFDKGQEVERRCQRDIVQWAECRLDTHSTWFDSLSTHTVSCALPSEAQKQKEKN